MKDHSGTSLSGAAMAYKEVLRVEIQEVIRRWQAGNSQRSIALGRGLSRDTVRKYLSAAREAGVAGEGPVPTEDQLSVLASVSRSGRGWRRLPARTCWLPGRTRCTTGSPWTVCNLPGSGNYWQLEGAGCPTRPCTGSSFAGTGEAGAGVRSGWERVHPAR